MNILRIYFDQYEVLLTMQTVGKRIKPETFKFHPVFRDADGENPTFGEAVNMTYAEAKLLLPIEYIT